MNNFDQEEKTVNVSLYPDHVYNILTYRLHM